MTKLEAWKAWCATTGTGDLLANQFTLENSSHGKAFSYAWDAAALAEREACAKVCDDMEEKAEGTECCKWPTPADCAAALRARGQA